MLDHVAVVGDPVACCMNCDDPQSVILLPTCVSSMDTLTNAAAVCLNYDAGNALQIGYDTLTGGFE